MGKYIDKDEVVAEIEKRIKKLKNLHFDTVTSYAREISCLERLLSFIDTLEVKDLNIEKESELIANKIMIGVQANKYHTNVYNTKRNDFNHSHLCFAARKGIELGLKAQKGE
jgi:hypothetical protein